MHDKANYDKRLKDDSWRILKIKAKKSNIPQNCWACDGIATDLNHRHYATFWNEVTETDLNWFCSTCHDEWTLFYNKNAGQSSRFRYEIGNDWIRLQRKNNRLPQLPDYLFKPIFDDLVKFPVKSPRKEAGSLCQEPTKKGFCRVKRNDYGKCHIHDLRVRITHKEKLG